MAFYIHFLFFVFGKGGGSADVEMGYRTERHITVLIQGVKAAKEDDEE